MYIKFKTFDNADLIRSSLPQLIDSPAQWQVVNGSVTDQRLSLRLKSRNQLAEPALGDVMANGIALSNSETGNGAVSDTQMSGDINTVAPRLMIIDDDTSHLASLVKIFQKIICFQNCKIIFTHME